VYHPTVKVINIPADDDVHAAAKDGALAARIPMKDWIARAIMAYAHVHTWTDTPADISGTPGVQTCGCGAMRGFRGMSGMVHSLNIDPALPGSERTVKTTWADGKIVGVEEICSE
jgi:hypothetical protein